MAYDFLRSENKPSDPACCMPMTGRNSIISCAQFANNCDYDCNEMRMRNKCTKLISISCFSKCYSNWNQLRRGTRMAVGKIYLMTWILLVTILLIYRNQCNTNIEHPSYAIIYDVRHSKANMLRAKQCYVFVSTSCDFSGFFRRHHWYFSVELFTDAARIMQ